MAYSSANSITGGAGVRDSRRAARSFAAALRRRERQVAAQAFQNYEPATQASPSRGALQREFTDPEPLLRRAYSPVAGPTLETNTSAAESAIASMAPRPGPFGGGGTNPPTTVEALMVAASLGLPGAGLAIRGGSALRTALGAAQGARRSRSPKDPYELPHPLPQPGKRPTPREMWNVLRLIRRHPLVEGTYSNYFSGGGPVSLSDEGFNR